MRYRYFLLLLSFPALSFAQDIKQNVIGSAGDDFKNNKVSVSWTIGEAITETLITESYVLSQGFHQGNLTVIGVDNDFPAEFQIKAYPNPVKDLLIIETQEPGLKYQLIDVHGRVISNGFLHSSSEEIDCTTFPSGTYFLQVKKHKTYKIIKH